jgi:hypothetical protein
MRLGGHTLGKILPDGGLESLPQLDKKQFMAFENAEQLNEEIALLTGKELIIG